MPTIFSFIELFPDELSAVKFTGKTTVERQHSRLSVLRGRAVPSDKEDIGAQMLVLQKNFTVRIGTIFEGSKLPLRKWLYGMYLLSTARKGISSIQLSKELNITQKSSWFMLRRLRDACDNGGNKALSGIVEMDGFMRKQKKSEARTANLCRVCGKEASRPPMYARR